MQILELIFRSFWTFSGTVIILCVIFEGAADIVRAARGNHSEKKCEQDEQEATQ